MSTIETINCPPSVRVCTHTRRDIDIYNSKAPHIKKTAGTTEEERESFYSWLKEGKMVDAFRRLHPDAKGAYTYWSVRTGAVRVKK